VNYSKRDWQNQGKGKGVPVPVFDIYSSTRS